MSQMEQGIAAESALVLVVDDEAISRRLATVAAQRSGLRVAEVDNGQRALEFFSEAKPDLVLLDVVMPGMSGFEVCARLRALPSGAATPVLIMTGLDDSASIHQAYESGATDFITKPLAPSILAYRLKYMLRTARTERALRQRNDELALTNQELHDARSQLLQAEKMASIGLLAAGVAHEINNPVGYVKSNLSSLNTYVKQLLDVIREYERAESALADGQAFARVSAVKSGVDLPYLSEDVFALISESSDGIDRVTKIVQDLKDFSRVGSDEEWCWVNLHDGLDSTLNIVNNEIKYKARLVKEYGNLPDVECLPSELNQVFMNLLVNAAHAIETAGTITVRTGADESSVWIEVADTGKGIPAEDVNRIFDPFFTTKAVGKGTGLGLSLSFGIVQKHRGRIDVHSEVGRGTTFRVTLPVSQKSVAPTGAQSA